MDWRDYYSGPTVEEQAWDEMRQDYLSKAMGFPERMDLSPEEWLDHIKLAQISNDLSALAGTPRSAPGIGYMFESPQSAQQNALRYAWEDEWAKRLSTPDYDPRYAQRATSFSPQFGGVYVDPFVNERTGQERVALSQPRNIGPLSQSMLPSMTANKPQARNMPTGFPIPPLPEQITSNEAYEKYLKDLTKQEEKQQRAAEKEYYQTGKTEAAMVSEAQRDIRKQALRAQKEEKQALNAARKIQNKRPPIKTWDREIYNKASDLFPKDPQLRLEFIADVKLAEMRHGLEGARKVIEDELRKRQKKAK